MKRYIAIFLIILLVANLVLFAMRRINELTFWVVIAAGFISAYILFPKSAKDKKKGKQ